MKTAPGATAVQVVYPARRGARDFGVSRILDAISGSDLRQEHASLVPAFPEGTDPLVRRAIAELLHKDPGGKGRRMRAGSPSCPSRLARCPVRSGARATVPCRGKARSRRRLT